MVSTTEAGCAEDQALQALETLHQARAVRERATEILAAAERGGLSHFTVHPQQLPVVAEQVAALCRERFPDLDIPLHSRWRHFQSGGVDRWKQLQSSFQDTDSRARAAFDLVITSVLLDAGAGMAWRYADSDSDLLLSRSEGLGVASFTLFTSGGLSSDPGSPLQADAEGLMAVDAATIEQTFQVRTNNPLIGVPGRVSLLNNLGRILRSMPELFPTDHPRPGDLYDVLKAQASAATAGAELSLPAAAVLNTVLRAFSGIWPGRLSLAGRNLGDVWRHPAIVRIDPSNGLMPFHKLSQWLSYSLVEPLQEAGIEIIRLDELTGLAEYRNGGLFIDYGVLGLRDDGALSREHPADSELVVEWRALTVALLDRLAPLVRENLGVTSKQLPLAKILEGGTWLAGRNIARQRREDGGPPLRIISDGTVF